MKTAQQTTVSDHEIAPTLSLDQIKKLQAIRQKVVEIVRKMDDYPAPVVRSRAKVEA
jgi:hypothetical protein